MSDFQLRLLHYSDVDDLIQLAQVAFADEFAMQGMTPDAFTTQMRMLTRGRMLPFKLLTRLSRITWDVVVALADGKVVGCGMYSGRRTMVLSLLMVDPAYRRRGIGQALLKRRLELIRRRGYRFATVTALATNVASLGNLRKQGFQVFDQHSLYEHALPLPAPAGPAPEGLTSRPIRPSDRPLLLALERRTSAPTALEVRDSLASIYLPSPPDRAYTRLARLRTWKRAFELRGEPAGFLAVESSREQTKGMVLRPLLDDQHIPLLPAMLAEAGAWLSRQDKPALQVSLPDDRPALGELLLSQGWSKVLTWLDLVKWFE